MLQHDIPVEWSEITFRIPYNVPSSKNGKVWTGKYFVVSAALTKWRKLTKEYWELERERFKLAATLSNTPVLFIHMTFIKSTKTLFDYFGPGETIADEMVRQRWINDDNAYQIVPVFGKFRVSREEAGVEIRLLKSIPKYEFL